MSVGGRCEMKMVMKAEKEGNEGVFELSNTQNMAHEKASKCSSEYHEEHRGIFLRTPRNVPQNITKNTEEYS